MKHLHSLLSRVAFGGAFSSLTWGQIRNLRARYWSAGNDGKRRLRYLRQFLRRRARLRLTVAPALASAAGAVAAMLPDRAWAACGLAALAVALPLAVFGATAGQRWIDRRLPQAKASRGIESWGAPHVCREFELAVIGARSRHGNVFWDLVGSGEVSRPAPLGRRRVRPTDGVRDLFSSAPVARRATRPVTSAAAT